MPEVDGIKMLEGWGVQDPAEIDATEYHAIYEALAAALTEHERGEEYSDPPETFALAILDDFINHAKNIKVKVVTSWKKDQEIPQ